MSTERLLEIKKQIDQAEKSQSEITGQIKSVVGQMKQEFNVSDLAEAETELDKIGKELDKQEAEFNNELEKLEKAYDWELEK